MEPNIPASEPQKSTSGAAAVGQVKASHDPVKPNREADIFSPALPEKGNFGFDLQKQPSQLLPAN